MVRVLRVMIYSIISFLMFFTIIFDRSSFPTLNIQENVLVSKMNTFYPVYSSKFIKYAYPSRPFDTQVELIGFSWQDERFTLVFQTTLLNENYYSHIPKSFVPIVEYKGKEFVLAKKLWTEGSLEGYRKNVSLYAITSENPTVPNGVVPDAIKINGEEFSIPNQLPKPTVFSEIGIWKRDLVNINQQINYEGITYTIRKLKCTEENRTVTIEVESRKDRVKEKRIFLLRDQKGRIYTFKKSSIPYEYKKGINSVELQVNDIMPHNIESLEFVIFKGEFIQSYLFDVVEENSVKIF